MKKALVICKETYAYPMVYITEELIKRGYEVEAFFIHSTELVLDDPSYSSFVLSHPTLVCHSFVEEFKLFIENFNSLNTNIDYEYLEYIENKYCEEIPLSLLQVSSQLFTTMYHYRFYFEDLSEEKKLYWTQLVFKKIESIMLEGNFDLVCDLDIAEFGRSALHRVCMYSNINYLTLEFSRFNNIVLPTGMLGRKTDKYFIDAYNENFNNNIEKEYIDLVKMFSSQDRLMNDSYKINNTSKNQLRPLAKDIKKFASYIKNVIKTIPRWVKFRKAPPLANPFLSIVFFIKWFFRERYLLSANNKFFSEIIANEKYVYFPLHLIPESTTLNKSPFFPNEISVIEAVSKALPVGWKLYVKEHGAMVGERPLSFYKHIQRLSNVKFIRMNTYDDPKPWLLNSEGVITLSGTSAFEASLCNKPSIIFGNAFFEVLDNITKINSFTELPGAINKFKTYNGTSLNSQAAYLKTIMQLGTKVNILQLLKDSENSARCSLILPIESKEYISNIVDMYEKEYLQWA